MQETWSVGRGKRHRSIPMWLICRRSVSQSTLLPELNPGSLNDGELLLTSKRSLAGRVMSCFSCPLQSNPPPHVLSFAEDTGKPHPRASTTIQLESKTHASAGIFLRPVILAVKTTTTERHLSQSHPLAIQSARGSVEGKVHFDPSNSILPPPKTPLPHCRSGFLPM